MADTLTFDLVTPGRLLLSEQVEMVIVPGSEGYFGVLPKHAPVISTLRPGVIDVHQGGAVTRQFFVAGGFAEVSAAGATVLVEEACAVKDITRDMVENRKAEAAALADNAATDDDRKKAARARWVADEMAAVIARAG
ncbi:MAG: F0F1 ATP synthase subunit epsilon [Alphaproteobacteria bacterium]|nr:F0F1 ATP synthase subunit epsilon [Alphaproteobacteria bacterium]